MVIAWQDLRAKTSPVLILGVIATSLLTVTAVITYSTHANSEKVKSQSSVRTDVKSVQTTGTSLTQPSVSNQTQSSKGSSSSISSATTFDMSSSSTQGSVTINGETYSVPPSGEFHKTETNEDGTTSVNISLRAGNSQSNSTSSSSVNIYSQSQSVNQSVEGGSR